MYLAIPLRLRLHLNESKHTVSLANAFKNDKPIDGLVKAVLKHSEAAAFAQLVDDVRDYITTYLPHGGATVTDFSLVYTIAHFGESCRAFIPTGLASTHKMTNESLVTDG